MEFNDFDAACKQGFDDLGVVQQSLYKLLQEYRKGWRAACSRAKEFDDAVIERNLKKAEMLLGKDGYQVSLLGTFSSGKSILVNGLLEAPGFLPSSQGVCTLAVTEVIGSHGMQGEGVVIKYMTLDGSFRKVFGSDQFKDQLGHRIKDLSPFEEAAARKYVEQAIEAYEQAEEETIRYNATRLKGFLQALEQYRDRLNTTYTDSIVNKDDYLSAQGKSGDMIGGVGEGHMWLIERVFVTMTNEVLARENVKIVDLPGVDAPSAHDKEVTFAAVPDSDAAILVVGQRGFAMADKELIDRIAQFSAEIRNKIFVVVNKMDTLNAKELSEFEKAFWKDLQEKIHMMGLNLSKLYFTSAYVEEERLRERMGLLDEDRTHKLEALKQHLSECLKDVQKISNEGVRERLAPVFVDGGVKRLRQDLYSYLRHDIKRERIREIYLTLMNVREKWDWLLEPERGRIERGDRLRRDKTLHFFSETNGGVENAVAMFKEGKRPTKTGPFVKDEEEPQGKGGVGDGIKNLVNNLKQAVPNVISHVIDKQLSFEKIIAGLNVTRPMNVRQAALGEVVPRLKALFIEKVKSDLPSIASQNIEKILKKEAGGVEDTLEHFAREFREQYLDRYRNALSAFKEQMELVSELRVKEMLMPLDEIRVGAIAGDPNQWEERLEGEFRDTLKKKFTDVFIQYADSLIVLGTYYKDMADKFLSKFHKLMDDMYKAAEMRNFQVDLPIGYGARGDGQMEEKEMLQSIAEITDMAGTKIDNFRSQLAPTLGITTS